MLVIRLQRRGKKHQPTYRVVVGEKKSKLKGEQLEELGWVDDFQKKSSFKKDRILYWLKIGAKLSPTINNLLVDAKIIEGKKVKIKFPKKLEAKTVSQPAAEAFVAENQKA